jgi:hypothetical protein
MMKIVTSLNQTRNLFRQDLSWKKSARIVIASRRREHTWKSVRIVIASCRRKRNTVKEQSWSLSGAYAEKRGLMQEGPKTG